jgi:hypothetical protein
MNRKPKTQLTKAERIYVQEIEDEWGKDIADESRKAILEHLCIGCGDPLTSANKHLWYCKLCDVFNGEWPFRY